MTAPPSPAVAPDAAASRRGILWMLFTMFLFVSMDTLAKHLIQSYSLVQVVWGRYFFHVVLLSVILAPRLSRLIKTRRLGLQLVRSLLLLVTTGLFFASLRYVPLANASALLLVSPIIVTALSFPVLGERVGPRRWAGVVFGFAGALIIIRPGSDVMQLASLLPLAAAFCYAFYQISTRFLSHTEPVLTTLLYTAFVGTLVTSAAVPFEWRAPAPAEWPIFVMLGVIGGVGHFALIKSLTAAPAATVVPFTYTNMIWAPLYGFAVFSDIPDSWTIVGTLTIICSGLYIFHREHRRGPASDGQPDGSSP